MCYLGASSQTKSHMKKIFILMILCVFPNFILKAQFAGNTYICDQESFHLLKDLSNSSLKDGDIYVFKNWMGMLMCLIIEYGHLDIKYLNTGSLVLIIKLEYFEYLGT